MRKGADAELQSQVRTEAGKVIEEMPLIATAPDGTKLFSSESLTLFSRTKRDGGHSQVNVRGLSPVGFQIHEGVTLMAGRWMAPGTLECVVGAALARRIEGFEIGGAIVSGKHSFSIVGIFEGGGSGFESEVWMDGHLFVNIFNRADIRQSFIFRVTGDPDVAKARLEKEFEDDPRLRSCQVQVESVYYYNQSIMMTKVILTLGGFLTSIMSIGAMVGAMNTMYAAVSQRKREIGCLSALGFTPASIWMAFILESLCLALAGAVLGCLASLCFDGIRTGTTNWTTFSETAFEFTITWPILAKATGVALFMGFIGGFLPALQASRLKVVEALRRT